MLMRCYKAELSKLLKGKGIYIALAVMLVLIALYMLMAGLLNSVVGLPGFDGGTSIEEMVKNVPREKYSETIAGLKSQLDMLEKDNNTIWSRFVDTKGQYKTYIAIFEYLDKHEEIDVNKIKIPDSIVSMAVNRDAYTFMTTAISVIGEVAIFYAVIVMSSLLAGEFKEGTLKMQLLRPNSRNTIYTAKWLATFTLTVGLMIIGVIVSAVFSAFKFRFSSEDILCVIANKDVFLMNENVFVLLHLLCTMIALFVIIQFSSFISVITRYNRAVSMAIPIIILLSGNTIALLLQVAYLGIIDFSYNLLLTSFLVSGSMTIPGSSLYTAIPILVVYTALFMTTTYLQFKRSEL